MGDIDIDEESTSFVQAHVDEAYPLQVYHEDDAAGFESGLVQTATPEQKFQNWVKSHKKFHDAAIEFAHWLDRNPTTIACFVDIPTSVNSLQDQYDTAKKDYTEGDLTTLADQFITQFADAEHPTDDHVKADIVEFVKKNYFNKCLIN